MPFKVPLAVCLMAVLFPLQPPLSCEFPTTEEGRRTLAKTKGLEYNFFVIIHYFMLGLVYVLITMIARKYDDNQKKTKTLISALLLIVSQILCGHCISRLTPKDVTLTVIAVLVVSSVAYAVCVIMIALLYMETRHQQNQVDDDDAVVQGPQRNVQQQQGHQGGQQNQHDGGQQQQNIQQPQPKKGQQKSTKKRTKKNNYGFH